MEKVLLHNIKYKKTSSVVLNLQAKLNFSTQANCQLLYNRLTAQTSKLEVKFLDSYDMTYNQFETMRREYHMAEREVDEIEKERVDNAANRGGDILINAEESKIRPSLSTLKLFALKVLPLDVISVIISANPLNGALSVDPSLSTVL